MLCLGGGGGRTGGGYTFNYVNTEVVAGDLFNVYVNGYNQSEYGNGVICITLLWY